jgi:Barrel-sandwich domain of CusB or HlyD membrane-fusion
MKKKLIAFVILAAVIGGGAWLLNNKGQQHAHEMGPILLPVVVEARLLSAGHTRLTLPVVADVQAVRDSVISSRLMGYVTALPLFEGDRFKRGELLARLAMSPQNGAQAAGSLETDVLAAESNLKLEQERLRRAKVLYPIQGISQEQLQLAEAAHAGARSRLEVATENLRSATLIAPFNGVVSQRLVQAGDLVTPGKALLKITDLSAGSRLLVNVPESVNPAGLKIGDEVLPLTPWPEAGLQGLRRYEARRLDGALLPGSRIDARLVVFRSPEAVLLPRECLLNDDGQHATLLALKQSGAQMNQASVIPDQHAAPEHKTEHQAQHQAQHDAPPDMSTPANAHHHKPQSAGEIETIRISIAAHGEEGAVAAESTLAGRRVMCGSPDILSRLAAGAPFSIQAGKE